jgi:rhodanese-related sulfurtransferase
LSYYHRGKRDNRSGKWEEEAMLDTISRDALKAKIDRGEEFALVETLPEVAYHHAHLPGAINLPPDRVSELASRLLPDKSAEVVVYCSSPT